MPVGGDTTGIAQVNLVLVQMLFLDLTLGTLARYSLKLHFPSKFVVSPCMVALSVALLRKGPAAVHIVAHHVVMFCKSSWVATCCHALTCIVQKCTVRYQGTVVSMYFSRCCLCRSVSQAALWPHSFSTQCLCIQQSDQLWLL